MRLYYSPGAGSLAPHVALREAGRRFELERVDLRNQRTASGEAYAGINPKGDVPALQLDEVGGAILTQCSAILQYIADLAPDAHLAPPAGTFARYHLQEWLDFIAMELDGQFPPLLEPDTPVFTRERLRARIGERFYYLGGVLVDRGYLMGETFTVADAYLFAVLRWCERVELDLQLWPNVDAYFIRVEERQTVHDALAAEGLLEHHHHLRHTG